MFNDFEATPSRIRVIQLENGNELNLTATDPYGLISFSLKHGRLPDSLQGASFTDWHTAEIAAHKYVAQRQSVVAEIKVKESKVK